MNGLVIGGVIFVLWAMAHCRRKALAGKVMQPAALPITVQNSAAQESTYGRDTVVTGEPSAGIQQIAPVFQNYIPLGDFSQSPASSVDEINGPLSTTVAAVPSAFFGAKQVIAPMASTNHGQLTLTEQVWQGSQSYTRFTYSDGFSELKPDTMVM